MNSRERVISHLKGKPVDRIPNFSILMAFAARLYGRGMDEFCKDYRVLTEANIKACEDFGIDLLNTMSDPYRETADYGAPISYPHDALPVCKPLLKTPQDAAKLKPFKAENSVRMLDRLKAIETYKQKCGDFMPIMGWAEGCAAESSTLFGLTDFIYALYDEPDMVRDVMDICLETALDCIRAQVAAGADIIGVGDAVASILGPAVYKDLILPYEQKMFAEIRKCGAWGRLHICGNIEPILDDVMECGADIIDIDWMVDFSLAKSKLKEDMFICGNFNPVDVMNGTPESVRQAVSDCASAGGDRCIIMAGCEIPRDTPHANLLAVSEGIKAL